MKRLLFGTMLMVLAFFVPLAAVAQVGISVSIGLPPPIVFPEPPVVVVLPDTYYVYAVPGIEIDLFFWNGWWWRPWHGRWYRSRYYDRGWGYYGGVPQFYYDVDPGWRVHYRDRNWYGHYWDYERIDYQRLHRNWYTWQNNRHWQREQTWGVQNYRPRPQPQRQELRQQRQREYQQRPEVQQYQRERQQQQRQQQQRQQRQPQVQQQRQRQPQAQEPPQQPRGRVEPQRQEQRPQVEQPRRQPQVQQPRQEPQQRGREPQREEQRPQVQEPRQQSGERHEQQRQSEPQGKLEGGKGEKQDRREDDKR